MTTPGMKSAEEWIAKADATPIVESTTPGWRAALTKQIQLDAYRAGMTKAAEIATQCGQATAHLDYIKRCCDELATAIITERDAATSEEL